MRLWKKALCALAALLLALPAAFPAAAAKPGDRVIDTVLFRIDAPLCGHVPGAPVVRPEEEDVRVADDPCLWAMYINETDPWASVPYMGMFMAGQAYTAVLKFEPEEGCRFGAEAEAFVLDPETHDYVSCEILERTESSLTVTCRITADHDWNEEEYLAPTCQSGGYRKEVCRYDPSHRQTTVLEPDPEAHEWGEWQTVREATEAAEGERERTCALCGTTETESIPKPAVPDTEAHEPDTSRDTSEDPVESSPEDVTAERPEDIPLPQGTTPAGETHTPNQAGPENAEAEDEPGADAGEPVEEKEPGETRGWILAGCLAAVALGGVGGAFAHRRSRRR